MGRRALLKKLLVYTLYTVAGIFLIYPVFKFISFRKSQKKTIIFYANEQVSPVSFKEGVFLLVKEKKATVLSARCPHLGCTLDYDAISQSFQCPCHGSRFDLSGKKVAGPAKKDLENIPMTKNSSGDIVVTLTL